MTLFLITGVSSPAHALERFVTESGQEKQVLRQVLVKFKPGHAGARAGAMSSMGVAHSHQIPRIGVDVLPVPDGQTVQSFVKQLKEHYGNDIEYVEPNQVLHKLDSPNDPSFTNGNQYYLKSNTTDIQSAWDITTGTPSVVVAVIDTGASLNNPDLINQFWVNPATTATSGLHGTRLRIDWNGDGDCTDPATGAPNDPGPEQCEGPDPSDDNGPEFHGTRVSGIIAAETNNGNLMAGIARGCRIMAVKALNSEGSSGFDTVAEGITYAVTNGASIINMSLGDSDGTSTSQAVSDAVADAIAHNVVVVAASGNSGNSVQVVFPARIPSVIAVGATNSANVLASFSCTGSNLDLVAPGVDIVSLSSNTVTALGDSGNNGTSFSSPMVAAVAALIRSLSPTMSVQDVTDYINFTATDLGEEGPDTGYGHGLLNANLALQSVQQGTILGGRLTAQSSGQTYPYPNPFNPLTTGNVTIALPSSLGNEGIEIKLFNSAGELVKTMTGTKQWNGKNDDGSYVAPGMYFYYAKTSQGNISGKLTVQQ